MEARRVKTETANTWAKWRNTRDARVRVRKTPLYTSADVVGRVGRSGMDGREDEMVRRLGGMGV